MTGSPHQNITVTNYPEDRFQRLEKTVTEKGLKMEGEDGEMKDFGADVKFSHDAKTNVLTLTVLHGPHLHSFDDFVTKLTSWVEQQA